MQSIEQHYYRETGEQNSNGCKLLVKKDAMLDSLDARERSYDNSANGINFTIRKVNLMFVFIVVVWIFFFNKYMIQNPVFFVYNVIMLSIVYAIVLSQATQGHVSRKSQRLIHERVTRCVTQSELCLEPLVKYIGKICTNITPTTMLKA